MTSQEINQKVIDEAFNEDLNVCILSSPCLPVKCASLPHRFSCKKCPICDHGSYKDNGEWSDSIHCLPVT